MERGSLKDSLTVVIPVYNETVLLESTFAKVMAFIRETKDVSVDVIFVDDGSPDESARMLQQLIDGSRALTMRLIRYKPNQGKGYAVRAGMMRAGGNWILMSDADLSSPLEEWRKLKDAMDSGADIACGSRAVDGAQVGKPPPMHRRILSRVFNVLVHLAGVRDMKDTQCGFKLFRREAAHQIFGRLRTRRFAFDVEVIACARRLGYRIVEVPVVWNYSGHTTVCVLSSGMRMLWDLMLIVLRRWTGQL